MVLPNVQFNVHKKGKKGVTVLYNSELPNFVSGSRVYTFMQITPHHFINHLWPAFANQRARKASFHCVYRRLSPMRWALSTTWRRGTTFYFIFYFFFGTIMTLRQCAEKFSFFRFQDLCSQMMSGVYSCVQPVCAKILNCHAGHDKQLLDTFQDHYSNT